MFHYHLVHGAWPVIGWGSDIRIRRYHEAVIYAYDVSAQADTMQAEGARVQLPTGVDDGLRRIVSSAELELADRASTSERGGLQDSVEGGPGVLEGDGARDAPGARAARIVGGAQRAWRAARSGVTASIRRGSDSNELASTSSRMRSLATVSRPPPAQPLVKQPRYGSAVNLHPYAAGVASDVHAVSPSLANRHLRNLAQPRSCIRERANSLSGPLKLVSGGYTAAAVSVADTGERSVRRSLGVPWLTARPVAHTAPGEGELARGALPGALCCAHLPPQPRDQPAQLQPRSAMHSRWSASSVLPSAASSPRELARESVAQRASGGSGGQAAAALRCGSDLLRERMTSPLSGRLSARVFPAGGGRFTGAGGADLLHSPISIAGTALAPQLQRRSSASRRSDVSIMSAPDLSMLTAQVRSLHGSSSVVEGDTQPALASTAGRSAGRSGAVGPGSAAGGASCRQLPAGYGGRSKAELVALFERALASASATRSRSSLPVAACGLLIVALRLQADTPQSMSASSRLLPRLQPSGWWCGGTRSP